MAKQIAKLYRFPSYQDYASFLGWCIKRDVNVWRSYWDEEEKDDRLYFIDWFAFDKRLLYSDYDFWKWGYDKWNNYNEIQIVVPTVKIVEGDITITEEKIVETWEVKFGHVCEK